MPPQSPGPNPGMKSQPPYPNQQPMPSPPNYGVNIRQKGPMGPSGPPGNFPPQGNQFFGPRGSFPPNSGPQNPPYGQQPMVLIALIISHPQYANYRKKSFVIKVKIWLRKLCLQNISFKLIK